MVDFLLFLDRECAKVGEIMFQYDEDIRDCESRSELLRLALVMYRCP